MVYGRAVEGEVGIGYPGLNPGCSGWPAYRLRLYLIPITGEEQVEIGALYHAPVAFSLLVENEFLKADLRLSLLIDLLPGGAIQLIYLFS